MTATIWPVIWFTRAYMATQAAKMHHQYFIVTVTVCGTLHENYCGKHKFYVCARVGGIGSAPHGGVDGKSEASMHVVPRPLLLATLLPLSEQSMGLATESAQLPLPASVSRPCLWRPGSSPAAKTS